MSNVTSCDYCGETTGVTDDSWLRITSMSGTATALGVLHGDYCSISCVADKIAATAMAEAVSRGGDAVLTADVPFAR